MENGVKVDNVPIKDMIAILANLALYYDAVDIMVYPDERRVMINPVETDDKEIETNPNKAEIRGKDLEDLI